MSRISWIRNLFISRKRANRQTPPRERLAVETLEDRVTPAAIGLTTPETYVEDTPLNLADIVIDGAGNATATLTLSNTAAGSLSTAMSGAVTSTFDAAAGVWTATGLIADVNTLLADVVFTPSPNFNANFDIATSITNGGTFTGDKVMTGTQVNDQPTTNDQSITTSEDLARAGMLTGDDGDAEATQTLTFAIASQPSHGAVTLDNPATGAFTYTPAANYQGPDSFTFMVTDDASAGGAALDSAAAAVSITVGGVNDRPTANDLSFSTNEDTSFSGMLTGDDGDPGITQTLTFAIATQPTHGAVTLDDPATGAFTYTPDANYNGPDSFTFTVTDDATAGGPALTSLPGTGTVTVNAVNDAPVLTVPGQQTTAEDVAVTITGILVSDVDVNEGTGEIKITLSAGSGSLTVGTAVTGGLSAGQISGNGTNSVVLQGPIDAVNATLAAGVTYQGNLNFNGADTLTVMADDLGNTGAGGPQTAQATVAIHVLSPTEQVAALRQMVLDLAAAGAFKNKGRLNSLLTKLRQIDAALAKGHGKVAYNVAGAFMNHVRAFRKARILTAAQADPLLAAAAQLRTSLSMGGFAVTSSSTTSATHSTNPSNGHGAGNAPGAGNGPSANNGNAQHGNGGQGAAGAIDTPPPDATTGHGHGSQNGKGQGKGKKS